jgi:hypothetical protein
MHTCAIMWKVCFQELRSLTNTKQLSEVGMNINPMELNDVYEHVWNLGVLLQTNDCRTILQMTYRPWPKVPLTILQMTYLTILQMTLSYNPFFRRSDRQRQDL